MVRAYAQPDARTKLPTVEDVSAPALFFVLRHDGAWKISLDGKLYGPYASQNDALHAATEAATMVGRRRGAAQVQVQAQSKNFTTAWTFASSDRAQATLTAGAAQSPGLVQVRRTARKKA